MDTEGKKECCKESKLQSKCEIADEWKNRRHSRKYRKGLKEGNS